MPVVSEVIVVWRAGKPPWVTVLAWRTHRRRGKLWPVFTRSPGKTRNFSNYPKTSMPLPQLVEAVPVARLGRSLLHVGTCALNRD